MSLLLRPERWRNGATALLLIVGLQQLCSAAYIEAKAVLAQFLIAQAWDKSLAQGGIPVKPWPWADTFPVARLEFPEHSEDLYVLSGATGHALAFGPGYEPASAPLGQLGLSVIGGHRDTHFSFLEGVAPGTQFTLLLLKGEKITYHVTDAQVVDSSDGILTTAVRGISELQLVTCYPFDALLPGGPLRFVVSAEPVRELEKITAVFADQFPHGILEL